MLKKIMMLFTALPLTLALCSEASAGGLSSAAKDRKELCKTLKNVKANDPRYILKQYCDSITGSLHCTSGSRTFRKVKGVCDDPNICTNELIKKACEEQCLYNRNKKLEQLDEKAKKIKEALDRCPVKPGMNDIKTPTKQSTVTSETLPGIEIGVIRKSW